MLEKWPGIAPPLLLSQVNNTAHFALVNPGSSYLSVVAGANTYKLESTDLFQYFCLLASAHYTTVATFVPTDLDNSIRLKLWNQMSPHEKAKTATWIIESLKFDFSLVSTRWVVSPSGEILHGHHGEWFSMAAASYGACRRGLPHIARATAEAIRDEIARESKIVKEICETENGLDLLRASTLVSHNLGDLDRVLEAWGVKQDDAILGEYYKAGHRSADPALIYLKAAGDLNKMMMADENHRHFALRKPKCLRRYRELLLPIGPFFDDWGSKVATHRELAPAEVGDVAEALIDGWERVGGFGYARALTGIENHFPGGQSAVERELPARAARILRSGTLRTRISEDRHRFERRWANKALEVFADFVVARRPGRRSNPYLKVVGSVVT